MCWSSCKIWSCYMDWWCSTWWRIGISVVVSSWSNGLSADRSKRYVDARWRKNITFLMFACNYMEQQRLSSEIGIQMHTCKSNNPNDKFTANDFFKWRNSITILHVYEEYQRNCCLLSRYFGQFTCNSKVFRPTNIVCNFISWWQLLARSKNVTSKYYIWRSNS